jgi:uncharacterized membrane protein
MSESSQSNVFALLFSDTTGADNFYAALEGLADEGLVTIVDAVIAMRNAGQDVNVRQMTPKKTGRYATGGGGIGFLAGMLLGGPILGLAAGAGIGAITARMKNHGMDHDFVNDIVQGMQPETSVLFVMTQDGNVDKLREALRPYKAVVLTTSLTGEQEQELQQLLKDEE